VWGALAAAVLLGLPSTARGAGDEPAGDARKVKIEGVVVRPTHPQRTPRKLVTVILGETEKGRRVLVTALSIDAGAKASRLSAQSGTKEVQSSLINRGEIYDEWVRTQLKKISADESGGSIVLDQALSSIEVFCPHEVSGGEAIVIEVTGVGDVNDSWDTWLVYPSAGDKPGEVLSPDGSRYEQQTLEAGAKTGGGKKLTASFNTFPADKGKLLGVCIARRESMEKRVLWVRIR
jgi:hypothetical protein